MGEPSSYTREEMACPWDYGCLESSEDDSSDWNDEEKKVEIPEQLRRPGSAMLRSLDVPLQNSTFSEYLERMKETFQVERLEESTIGYIISTTKKFLEFTSRNVTNYPENDGINHHMFTKYVQALSTGGVQDSTIINHLTYLQKWAVYVESFENFNIPKSVYATIKSLQKGMRKKRSREIKKAEILTTEQSMVESGCWPRGGIKELRNQDIR